MPVTCPCCGQPVDRMPAKGLAELVDGYRRRIVEELASVYPGSMTMEQLIHALYGDDPEGGPLAADNSISVYNWRIRKVIEPHGWTIPLQSKAGAHYRLARIDVVNPSP